MERGEKHSDHVWAIGLMSGTSLDGLDAALIRTNGIEVSAHGPVLSHPMPADLRDRLRDAMHGQGDWLMAEQQFTLENISLVKELLRQAKVKPYDVAVIGFHGQTLAHRPADGITWQIGNGALLAEKTGIAVVNDFRRRDMAAGGEGAPLVPLYHAALAREMELPLAVLNLGGIANVTWIGRSENSHDSLLELDIVAFDTGPGNALLNDWMHRHKGVEYDEDGRVSLSGTVDEAVLARYLTHPYFHRLPPKSLDRHDFDLSLVQPLDVEDGAATLSAFTVRAAVTAERLFPAKVKRWLVTGGGRHNRAIMRGLQDALGQRVDPVEAVGWRGDALEAEAFAFLGVRARLKLPLSLPTITGANKVVTGGAFHAV